MRAHCFRTCFGRITLLGTLTALAGCDRAGSVPAPNPPVVAREADNTGRNAEAREGAQSTPMDQSEKPADIKITAEIRSALMADSAMSVNAKNCKVITSDGTVTLEGVVDTQGERDLIESKAKAVAGVSAVVNRLQVKDR